MGVVDQPNEISGNQLTVLEHDDLRTLSFIVDQKADAGEPGFGSAGYAARVFRFLAVQELVLWLADESALNLPRTHALRCHRSCRDGGQPDYHSRECKRGGSRQVELV